MIIEYSKSEKTNTFFQFEHLGLVGMKFKIETFSDKYIYFSFIFFKHFAGVMQDSKIINISYVIFDSQFMLDKLIKFIEVDIGKELRNDLLPTLKG